MSGSLRWPDDFPDPAPVTEFDAALLAYFDQVIASGGAVCVDRDWGCFGFSRGERMIEFVRRGQLRRGSGLAWEVLPSEKGKLSRLGSLFGIRPHACVVVSGIADVRTATDCWLNGASLESLPGVATFWDKVNTSEPLEPVA